MTSCGFPPVFVISMKRSVGRREAMKRELAGFDFEFIDAVDGEQLDEDRFRHRLQTEWWRIMRGRQLSPSEIGCFLSHYGVWQRIVDTRTPHALVLEDDARLAGGGGFADNVVELMGMTMEWDIVHLAPKRRYRLDRVFVVLRDGRRLIRFRRRHAGAVGYLISLEAAEALLHYCWRIRAPIDWLYAEWWENGLAFRVIEPGIVRHAGLPSTIKPLPKVRRSPLEHAAATLFRCADVVHLRAASWRERRPTDLPTDLYPPL